MDNEMPVTSTLALPRPTFAGGRRFAWSVVGGYARLVARVAAVVACGVALNWGFLAFAAWQFGAASPGILYGTMIVVGFGLGFPLAFFVVGQKQGIQILLRHCYQRHDATVLDFILVLLRRALISSDGSDRVIGVDNIRAALKRIDEMPWVIRFALKRYLMHEAFQAIALEIMGDADFRLGNLASVKERYSARVTKCIMETVLTVDTRWFWILAGANSAAIAIVWLILRAL
jgi:hypothetical protein